jgi:Fe-S cluster assembly protein SufD
MTARTPSTQSFLDAHAAFTAAAPGNGASWVASIRSEAIDRFAARGFPGPKDEAWRYTSVAPIARGGFALPRVVREDVLTPEQFERLTFEPWACSHLVFVNGRFAPGLSSLLDLPRGVRVGSLQQALASQRERVEPHLGRHADGAQHPFVALNTAFLQDGAYLEVPRGVVVEEPIHLLFISTPNGGPSMSHPRTLVIAGERSQVALVESYAGFGEARYFTNAVTEVVVGDGARVEHTKLQRESLGAYHVATLQFDLGRGAALTSHSISLGGALARNDLNVVLGAEGGDCTLNGLYVVEGRQHVDNHTLIDHARPHGTSRELYKGVLDGQARGVFDGTVVVRKDAQKTDARQENRNLLISEEALVDSKPTLMIHADDVKCSHAATIGQLDDNALFYVRSRGVGEAAARNLLTRAFVSDIIHRVGIEPVRAGLECLLFTQMRRHPAGAVAP